MFDKRKKVRAAVSRPDLLYVMGMGAIPPPVWCSRRRMDESWSWREMYGRERERESLQPEGALRGRQAVALTASV